MNERPVNRIESAIERREAEIDKKPKNPNIEISDFYVVIGQRMISTAFLRLKIDERIISDSACHQNPVQAIMTVFNRVIGGNNQGGELIQNNISFNSYGIDVGVGVKWPGRYFWGYSRAEELYLGIIESIIDSFQRFSAETAS
jgi:hypothetical protein